MPLGVVDSRPAGHQHQATADGQKHLGLQQQEEDANGRARCDLRPGLDKQGELQQHRGHGGQHIGCAERAEGIKKHGGLTDLCMLVT